MVIRLPRTTPAPNSIRRCRHNKKLAAKTSIRATRHKGRSRRRLRREYKFSLYSEDALSARYEATPSAVGSMPGLPGAQPAGQTMPLVAKNSNASNMRNTSSMLRPSGKLLTVCDCTMPSLSIKKVPRKANVVSSCNTS